MANLQEKGRKEAVRQAESDRRNRRLNGYTVFRFDFAPKYTIRDLTLGEAIRELKRLTGYKIGFWRCPVRGLAVRFLSPPQTTFIFDSGDSSRLMHFSQAEDEVSAKRELILDVLLGGIENYRALPNSVFDEQVSIIRSLLTAASSVSQEEWLSLKAKLHPKIRPLMKTHESDLRKNLLDSMA